MKNNKLKENKFAQEMQDEIFRKMPAEKKIGLVFELSAFCLELNSLNGTGKTKKYSRKAG